MLPHSYRDLFSYLIWRGNFWHSIWIFATFWTLGVLWRFFTVCATLQGAWRFLANFCQIVPVSLKSPPSKGPLLESNLSRRPSGDFSPLHAFLDISDLMTVLLCFIKQQEIHRVNKLLDVAFFFMHDTCQDVDQSEGRLVLERYQAKYIFESFLPLLKQKKLQCIWMNWSSILQDKRKAACFGPPSPVPALAESLLSLTCIPPCQSV